MKNFLSVFRWVWEGKLLLLCTTTFFCHSLYIYIYLHNLCWNFYKNLLLLFLSLFPFLCCCFIYLIFFVDSSCLIVEIFMLLFFPRLLLMFLLLFLFTFLQTIRDLQSPKIKLNKHYVEERKKVFACLSLSFFRFFFVLDFWDVLGEVLAVDLADCLIFFTQKFNFIPSWFEFSDHRSQWIKQTLYYILFETNLTFNY